MVLGAVDPRAGDEFAFRRHQRSARVSLDADGLRAKDEFEFKADHPAGINSLLRQHLEICRRKAILRPPRPQVPELRKEIAPGGEPLRELLARLKARPQIDHLTQRSGVRNHQIESRALVERIGVQVFSADELQTGDLGDRPGEITDVVGQFEDKEPFGREAGCVGAELERIAPFGKRLREAL